MLIELPTRFAVKTLHEVCSDLEVNKLRENFLIILVEVVQVRLLFLLFE